MKSTQRGQRTRRFAQMNALDYVDENNSVLGWQQQTTKNHPSNNNRHYGGDALDDFDIANKEHVDSLISDIQIEMNKRMDRALSKLETQEQALQETYAVSMISIPTSYRKLTVGEFNAMYGCNLIQFLKDEKLASKTIVPQRQQQGSVCPVNPYQTPARGARVRQTPGTARTIKKGEKMFSQNGSPVDKADVGDVIATVMKKHRMGSGINLEVNIGEGETVDLLDKDIKSKLDKETKNAVFSQCQALQEKLAAVANMMLD